MCDFAEKILKCLFSIKSQKQTVLQILHGDNATMTIRGIWNQKNPTPKCKKDRKDQKRLFDASVA